jgi:hypothetical protein
MLLLALALTAAPAAAAAKDAPPPQLQKLLQSCDAHKFETIVEVAAGDQTKHSRVKLCGTEGQSDADWIKTLEDAVAKTSVNLQMPAVVRDQIVSALKTEIARLNAVGSATSLGGLPPPRAAAKSSALDGLSALPPLPEPKAAAPAAVLPPPRMIAPAARPPEYASLPPLPTGPAAPTRVLVGGLSASLPQLPRPRMSFSCYTPGESIDGPCTGFTRDTLLTVQADEDLPNGTSVRFVRNGDARADVELAQLRKGKSQRFALPPEVCSHVSGGTLELRIVRSLPAAGPSGEEVGKDGPYDLRC